MLLLHICPLLHCAKHTPVILSNSKQGSHFEVIPSLEENPKPHNKIIKSANRMNCKLVSISLYLNNIKSPSTPTYKKKWLKGSQQSKSESPFYVYIQFQKDDMLHSLDKQKPVSKDEIHQIKPEKEEPKMELYINVIIF